MRIKDYKISASRLARFFKKSRDQWKQRAAEKQQRIRTLLVKIRDLTNSRDKWKQKATKLQQEINQQSKENAEKKTKKLSTPKIKQQ